MAWRPVKGWRRDSKAGDGRGRREAGAGIESRSGDAVRHSLNGGGRRERGGRLQHVRTGVRVHDPLVAAGGRGLDHEHLAGMHLPA